MRSLLCSFLFRILRLVSHRRSNGQIIHEIINGIIRSPSIFGFAADLFPRFCSHSIGRSYVRSWVHSTAFRDNSSVHFDLYQSILLCRIGCTCSSSLCNPHLIVSVSSVIIFRYLELAANRVIFKTFRILSPSNVMFSSVIYLFFLYVIFFCQQIPL